MIRWCHKFVPNVFFNRWLTFHLLAHHNKIWHFCLCQFCLIAIGMHWVQTRLRGHWHCVIRKFASEIAISRWAKVAQHSSRPNVNHFPTTTTPHLLRKESVNQICTFDMIIQSTSLHSLSSLKGHKPCLLLCILPSHEWW